MPMRFFLRGKIHRAVVTEADPDYVGSISIDPEMLKQSGIAPYEQVDVYNVDNGERLTTYAILGDPGQICLNGAAALKCEPGQRVIIAAYAWLDEAEVESHVPKVVIIEAGNRIVPAQ